MPELHPDSSLMEKTPFRRRIIAFAALLGSAGLAALVVSGCVPPAPDRSPLPPAPQQTTPAAPPPAPLAPVAPIEPLADNWMDVPQTPGDWIYRATGQDKRSTFLGQDGAPLFEMVCTTNRQIALIRPESSARTSASGTSASGTSASGTSASGTSASGTSASGTSGQFNILTETADRSLNTQSRAGALVAELPAQDSFLDAIAFSKGRFAVQASGLATLYLPAWPEVTRVIEDCR